MELLNCDLNQKAWRRALNNSLLSSAAPAGFCSLHLVHINATSIIVSWDGASGEFDSHRLTLSSASVKRTLTVAKEERVAVFTGLLDGCTYNVSAERVRGLTAGSAAFLTATTGIASHTRST